MTGELSPTGTKQVIKELRAELGAAKKLEAQLRGRMEWLERRVVELETKKCGY